MQLPATTVEVFKTNVLEEGEAQALLANLVTHFPGAKINFDLDDCDKILRVEDRLIFSDQIIEVMNRCGYQCQVLE